jgi:hypothetical protein
MEKSKERFDKIRESVERHADLTSVSTFNIPVTEIITNGLRFVGY